MKILSTTVVLAIYFLRPLTCVVLYFGQGIKEARKKRPEHPYKAHSPAAL
jgi:hypothetical protein